MSPLADDSTSLRLTALEAAVADLAGWHLDTGGGGVSLSRELIFPTADMAQGFAALAAVLSAVFQHHPVWSVVGRMVTVSLADVERGTVTSRHLALARAFNTLHRGFCEASEPEGRIPREGPLAPVTLHPAARPAQMERKTERET